MSLSECEGEGEGESRECRQIVGLLRSIEHLLSFWFVDKRKSAHRFVYKIVSQFLHKRECIPVCICIRVCTGVYVCVGVYAGLCKSRIYKFVYEHMLVGLYRYRYRPMCI